MIVIARALCAPPGLALTLWCGRQFFCLGGPRCSLGGGEVLGLYLAHFCSLTPSVGHLDDVACDRAVSPRGVGEASEGGGADTLVHRLP